MDHINSYGATRTSGNSYASKNTKKNELGVNDFMKLLSEQLANQDVMNPMQDTEFISQLAQFTSLQAMQTMSEVNYAQYGTSMVGKNVLVASYDENGLYKEDRGVAECVKFANGDCLITVNGKDYTMSSIMEVLDKATEPEKPEEGTGENTEDTDTSTKKPEGTVTE